MRKITFLAICLAFACIANAQKKNSQNKIPSFGDVSKEELQMKECDFDDKAEAVVLIDDGQLEFVAGDLELKRRIRIKILNDKGLEWANVHLPYMHEKGEQDIKGLEAHTYNLDASGNIVVNKLDKKLVYEKKLNKKYSEKIFTFADVKVGSVIEYKYKHIGVGLIPWYFQRSIPVKYSHFSVELPYQIEVATTPYCSREYVADRKTVGNNVLSSFKMENVPAFRNEPYVINEDYYRDRLETKLIAYPINGLRSNRIASWPGVIKFLMEDEDFGVQLKKEIPRTADLDAKLQSVTSPYERMKTIYKYVVSNMQWNEYTGIWALDGVKSAWKDKKGTVGEINLILVNLLKDAGLKANPVLVSTHENGVVNTLDAGTFDFPGFFQFNKVMAHVEINDRVYVLDATQKNIPVHLIPKDVLSTQGLVISKFENFEWGWTSLVNTNLYARNLVLINAEIDANGKMTGTATISSEDYAKLARMPIAKKGADKYLEHYITVANPGVSVDEVQFENLESDSLPLVQKINFKHTLNSAGEYQYFSVNMFSGLETNPFIADNRFSDVFFGYNQSTSIVGNFMLPDGFEFDQLPKNVKMIMPDTSIIFSRISQQEDGVLRTRIQVDFKRPVYSAASYPELQEFYKAMFDMLNEQFVVRKKKK